MSGDDAPNLRWSGTSGVGNGWLGPSIDRGTLQPQNSGQANWSVAPGGGLHYTVGNTQAQSTIRNTTAGLQVVITTTVTGLTANLRFDITNTNASTTITNLLIGDYFNFHPNGSSTSEGSSTVGDQRNQGRSYYLAGTDPRCRAGVACIYAEGNQSRADFISNGRMWGSLVSGSTVTPVNPTNWRLGSAGPFNPTNPSSPLGNSSQLWSLVQNNSYDNPSAGSVWPSITLRGDSAGAFQWNLGNLAAGQTVSFMITKEIVEVPEISAMQMMLGGLVFGISLFRKRGACNSLKGGIFG
jgi:hypothetical protein